MQKAITSASTTDVPGSGTTKAWTVSPEAESPVVEAEVLAFCAARLAGYKCPTAVTVVDAIPTGLAGKVLRRELRESS